MALLCAVSCVAAVLSAAFPMTPEAPVGLTLAGGAVAGVLGLLALAVPARAVLHAGLVAHAAGLAVLVAASRTGTGATALTVGYVWLGLYAGCFLGGVGARVHTALLAASLAAGLLAHPFPGAVHVGALVGGTLVLATEVVTRLVERLGQAARHDALTGLLNRAGLQERGDAVLAAARRHRLPACVAVADLDGFKLVNDAQGHAAGDALLVALADHWRAGVRRDDVLARLGGDEFVLVLPGTSAHEADRLLARLRGSAPAPFSVGVAQAGPGDDLAALLRRADDDLYRSKGDRRRGRDVPAPRRPAVSPAASSSGSA